MLLSLPVVKNDEEYEKIYKKDIWQPFMEEICKRHHLPIHELKRQKTGSAIVYESAGRIIKLYAPLWPEEVHRERLGLSHCTGLDLPIPDLEFEGKLENWDYIVMEKLAGVMLRDVWKELDAESKMNLVGDAASIIKSFHELPDIDDPWINLDWNEFLVKQKQNFPLQQKKMGLKEPWIEIFSQWLNEHALNIPYSEPRLLHCDLHHDHFLVDRQKGKWKVTGLIDFADAMKCHYLYEFGAPLVFITAGNIELKRAMLLGYGFNENELNEELENHLFASILLHRFTNVPWYIKNILPKPIEHLNDLKNYLCQLN